MESPGEVTLEGIVKIIKQIGELIKDLWSRRLEKQKRETELKEKEIELKKKEIELEIKKIEYAEALKKILRGRDYGLPFKPENELIAIIINGVSKLEQLEKDGKLENVPENIK